MVDAIQPGSSAQAYLEAQRRDDIALSEKILRGKEIPAQQMYDLAERLRKTNDFGSARRLYGRLWNTASWAEMNVTAAKVGQRHALATYKDQDLPAADRFTRALEILDDVDQLDLGAPPGGLSADRVAQFDRRSHEVTQRQESFGLRGAVYKRRWQLAGQRVDLERALGFYLKGYRAGLEFEKDTLGVETDQGYTGINAAFVLDLLALEDARQAGYAGMDSAVALSRVDEARTIRQLLAEKLPALAKREEYGWLKNEWWFHATLAEAHLGLGDCDAAISALREFNDVHRLEHQGPPLERVAPWEFESTLTQLTSLAQLQAELAGLLGHGASARRSPVDASKWGEAWRHASREYLGGFAPGLDRAEVGKVGLALSGGGFRASLFHIGVLAYLAERDVLRRVEVLSCVSGGSIIGAHLYLEVKRLLETTADTDITPQDYIALVERVERNFLVGVQTNIRARVFGSIWANLRTFFQPGYTTTRRLGELYERQLYASVADGCGSKPRYLSDLMIRPKGESAAFRPKYDNWRRHAKVPMLVLNATTLNTGHNWQFTATWMGEPPIGLDAEIEGNYRLRRMYHWEAPQLKDRWRRWYTRPFAPPDYQNIRLGEAVAASSCVPGLFEPIVLPNLYEGKTVRLVDGGVHDNQGVASLLEQDSNLLIVSDASGQMETEDNPSGGRLGVSLRSFNVSMSRVRQAQFRELAARRRSGLLKGLMFLHLKKDLDADPVDWRECQDPSDASDEARPADRRGVLTRFGLHKSVQRLLSNVRTDLDSFTDLEAFSLMLSGYLQAEEQFRSLSPQTGLAGPRHTWRFLAVEPLLMPGPHFEQTTRQLDVGSQTAFKVWRLSPVLGALAFVLLAAALVGVFQLWRTYQDRTLVTVRGLGSFVLVLAASLVLPQLVALLRFRQTIRGFGLKSLGATMLALAFKVHLLVFDPMFLRMGKLSRFLKTPAR